MRRGAIKSVLSERLREGGLVIVENFELPSHKTKELTTTLDALGLNERTLVVDSTRTATSRCRRAICATLPCRAERRERL